MSKLMRLFTFLNGTTADGGEVNQEFNNLLNGHNQLDEDVWVRINNTITASAEGRLINIGLDFPETPTAGLEFYHINQGQHYVHDGTKWRKANENAEILTWMGV